MKCRDGMLFLKPWFCMIIEIYWKIEISWKCKNKKCTNYLLVFKEAKSAYQCDKDRYQNKIRNEETHKALHKDN